MNPTQAANEHLKRSGHEVLAQFASLLQIPNVTGHVGDLRRNSVEIADRFSARGAAMEVIELDGASPVVIGRLRTENPTATVGVYVHYDGQPVDPDAWTYPPFSAQLLDGSLHGGGRPIDLPAEADHIDPEWRIYARGASDDKTPLAALPAALDALSSAGLTPTVDLVFLFEGEEESGSPNLERYMRELKTRLVADAWLLCDGPVHQSRLPLVSFGARGYSGFDLTFYGAEKEIHSGHYGNWVPNPAFELARFLATCKDDSGRVLIDGFYDDTLPISNEDRAAMERLPDVSSQLQSDLGFGGPEVSDATYPERLMLPSFNVRGIRAADVGDDARNVVPAQATVSVDIRLAAGDDPDRMVDRVEAHLVRAGYVVLDRDPTAEERRSHRRLARIDRAVGYRAARIPMASPLAETLLDVCRRAGDGDVVALPTFGGSVPLYLFEEVLGSSVAILPIANHDNNQHAADENLRVGNLWYGIHLWANLLSTDLSGIRLTS
ncbi:MAG TPA: M20/M25/M40 family metallo-hydrolase [Acidimicrobiia bacterium]|nr:M20/M25/M40 family metallo-hydrolase [Acidimicrobiia bacterium]